MATWAQLQQWYCMLGFSGWHWSFDSMWYSHKFKGPGFRYKVATSIQGGDIVWISGPYPCGKWPDISIFLHGLKSALHPSERVETNLGYRGEPKYINFPEDNIFGNPNQQRSKAIVRSRYETCNRHFKEWKCLSMMFWHALDKHGRIFCAGIVLTQIKIDYESKLFVVDYKTIVCNLTLIQKILV